MEAITSTVEWVATVLLIFISATFIMGFFQAFLEFREKKAEEELEKNWVVEVEEVETKSGIVYLLYNTMTNQFLWQTNTVDAILPWLLGEAEKHKDKKISLLHPNGEQVSLTSFDG